MGLLRKHGSSRQDESVWRCGRCGELVNSVFMRGAENPYRCPMCFNTHVDWSRVGEKRKSVKEARLLLRRESQPGEILQMYVLNYPEGIVLEPGDRLTVDIDMTWEE